MGMLDFAQAAQEADSPDNKAMAAGTLGAPGPSIKDTFAQVYAIAKEHPNMPTELLLQQVARVNNLDPTAFTQAFATYHKTGKFVEPSIGGQVMQGATANFSDELGGLATRIAVNAAMTPDLQKNLPPDYAKSQQDAQIDATRAANALYSKQHPVASVAANVAGSIPLVLAGGRLLGAAGNAIRGGEAAGAAAEATTLGQRARGVVLPGAAYGAAYGEGAGQGGAIDRLPEATAGAAIGAVTAPAVQVLGELGLAGAKKLYGAGSDILDRLTGKGPVVDAAPQLHPMEAEAATSPIAAAADASNAAPVQVAPNKAIYGTTAKAADARIAANAQSNGVDLAGLKDKIASGDVPDGFILADALGTENQSALRNSRTIDGGTAIRLDTALRQRNMGQNQAVASALDQMAGIEHVDPNAYIDAMDQAAKDAASPFYDQARSAPVVDPKTKVTVAAGKQTADMPLSDLLTKDKLVASALKDAKSSVQTADLPDTHPQVLDEVYKTLGDKAQSLSQAGEKYAASKAAAARDAIKQAIDSVSNGAYSTATKLYADGMGPKDAFQMGRDAWKKAFSTDDLNYTLQDMDGTAKEAYRKGMLVELGNMLQNANLAHDPATIFNNRSMQSKLQTLAGSPENYAKFMQTLEQLRQQRELSRFVSGGSNTADKLANIALDGESKPLTEQLAEAAKTVMRPEEAAGKAMGWLSQLKSSADARMAKDQAGYVMSQLTNRDPAAQMEYIDRLLKAQSRIERDAQLANAGSASVRGISGSVGGNAGATSKGFGLLPPLRAGVRGLLASP